MVLLCVITILDLKPRRRLPPSKPVEAVPWSTVNTGVIATRGDGGAAFAKARHHGRIGRDAASEIGQGHAARGRLTTAKTVRRVSGSVNP